MAHWLKDRGIEAYAVSGGVSALADEAPAATVPPPASAAAARGGALSALRHERFRRYSAGALLSLTGNWVEAAAFGYIVLLLGGSPAALGLIGFLNTIPNLVFGLPAGVLADRYDRRTLLLAFQGANMAVAVLLAALWQADALTVPLMGAIAIVGGSLGTLSFPAFQGMLASTVPARDERRRDQQPGAPAGALRRAGDRGRPASGYFLTAIAVALVGVSGSVPLSLALAIVGGFCGVMFVGLSTVVVQASASDAMRARAMAIWAAAFVGVLPLGGLITAGLAAWLGAGGAVLVDGLLMLAGGAAVMARRPQVAWLGCAALPEACVAGTDPAAVALEREPTAAPAAQARSA